jgi:hypothetical protein
VLAGEDADLTKWLGDRGIRCRRFAAAERAEREVILVSKAPPAFEELWQRVEQGAAAVFLTPEVFQKGDQSQVLPGRSTAETSSPRPTDHEPMNAASGASQLRHSPHLCRRGRNRSLRHRSGYAIR